MPQELRYICQSTWSIAAVPVNHIQRGVYVDRIDWEAIAPWMLTGGAGMIGRLMYHAKLVQAGQRKPFTWAMLLDVPIALGTGWIALGICSWAGLSWESTVSVAIVVGYLGPYGIDSVFARWADWKFGFDGSKKNPDSL